MKEYYKLNLIIWKMKYYIIVYIMTRIRRHTAAIHRRNIRKAKVRAFVAASHPMMAFIAENLIDFIL